MKNFWNKTPSGLPMFCKKGCSGWDHYACIRKWNPYSIKFMSSPTLSIDPIVRTWLSEYQTHVGRLSRVPLEDGMLIASPARRPRARAQIDTHWRFRKACLSRWPSPRQCFNSVTRRRQFRRALRAWRPGVCMYLQDSRPITCHSATRCSPVASFFQTVRLVPSSRCLLGPGSVVLCSGHWPFLPFWWLAFWAFVATGTQAKSNTKSR